MRLQSRAVAVIHPRKMSVSQLRHQQMPNLVVDAFLVRFLTPPLRFTVVNAPSFARAASGTIAGSAAAASAWSLHVDLCGGVDRGPVEGEKCYGNGSVQVPTGKSNTIFFVATWMQDARVHL